MNGVLLLTESGERIAAKYYRDKQLAETKAQFEFEARVHAKLNEMDVRPSSVESIIFEKYIMVFKVYGDGTRLIVFAPLEENELLVFSVLSAIDETLRWFVEDVNAKKLGSRLRFIMLIIDEVLDDGLVVDNEVNSIVQRLVATPEDSSTTVSTLNTGVRDHTLTGALFSVGEQLMKSLRS